MKYNSEVQQALKSKHECSWSSVKGVEISITPGSNDRTQPDHSLLRGLENRNECLEDGEGEQ